MSNNRIKVSVATDEGLMLSLMAENARLVAENAALKAELDALQPKPVTPDDRPELTARQAEFLAAVKDAIKAKGYPPTFDDLRQKMGFGSKNGAACHLFALEKKGYLRWDRRTARSIVLIG